MRQVTIDLRTASEKQKQFFRSAVTYTGYGGSRGGGKSWAVRAKAAWNAFRYPGIRQLIVRRTLPELEENHIRQMRELCEGAAVYKEQKKQLIFPNRSVIRFGYCDTENDVLQYQGQEYDCIFLDEATQLTEFQFQTFKGCMRGVNEFPKQMYVTCNPGGVGHAWVKRLFIDREYRSGERPEDYTFIQAGVQDNKILQEKDPDYIHRLEALPYELREMWLYGKWDIMAGAFFHEWSREVHVTEPFLVPEHWRWYVSMDYGMDMLAAYLICVDTVGNAWVTAEVYEGRDLGEGHNGLIISEAAERILDMVGDTPVYEYLAPPDLFNARQETGRSVADIFNEHGIYLTKTSNDRVAGWSAMREMLKVDEGENGTLTAKLKIWRGCTNLIRCIPLLQYDEHRPNDAANNPHEITHGPDALRGFCVHWVMNANEPPEPKKEKLIKQLKKKRRHY